MACWRSEEGSSLVELLVALAVGTMVMSILISMTYHICILTYAQGNAVKIGQDVESAFGMLNRDLVSASSWTITDGGDIDTLVIHSPSYTYGQPGGGTTSTITYSCASGVLTRDDGATQAVIARNVVGASYGASGEIQQAMVISITSAVADQRMSQQITVSRRPD